MTKGQIRAALAAVLVAGFLIAIGLLFWRGIPENNRELMSYMLGQLSGFVAAIVVFNFGSTQGSEDKTDMLVSRPDGTPADPVHVEEDAQPRPDTVPRPDFGG